MELPFVARCFLPYVAAARRLLLEQVFCGIVTGPAGTIVTAGHGPDPKRKVPDAAFTSVRAGRRVLHDPHLGIPVAIVLDGTDLTGEQMQRLARWTNLSETTFVLPPCASRKWRPCRSGGVVILVKDAAHSLVLADVDVGDQGLVGNRLWQGV